MLLSGENPFAVLCLVATPCRSQRVWIDLVFTAKLPTHWSTMVRFNDVESSRHNLDTPKLKRRIPNRSEGRVGTGSVNILVATSDPRDSYTSSAISTSRSVAVDRPCDNPIED